MTIEEYDRLNLVFEARQMQQTNEESKYMRENADELAAKYKREQLKRMKPPPSAKEQQQKEELRDSYEEHEPGTAARPFGSWQTVVRKYEQIK